MTLTPSPALARTFHHSIFTALLYRDPLLLDIVSGTVALLAALLFLPVLRDLFPLALPS